MKQWVLHNDGRIGIIMDCPTWLNFEALPPRSVYVNWEGEDYIHGDWRSGFSSTKVLTPIPKSVADILIAVNN